MLPHLPDRAHNYVQLRGYSDRLWEILQSQWNDLSKALVLPCQRHALRQKTDMIPTPREKRSTSLDQLQSNS
jgi:hypothetical protein